MGVKGNGSDRTQINVLVVRNDTTLFTDVLAKALASEPSVHLLSQPLTVDEALEFCIRRHPDVVLVEATEASGGSLRRLVSSLTGACDGSPVVLLADGLIDDAFLVAGVEGGAFGIVDGAAGIREVFRAVRAAAAGHRLVDTDQFLSAVESTARARDDGLDLAERVRQLTDRENEVLACLSEGLGTGRSRGGSRSVHGPWTSTSSTYFGSSMPDPDCTPSPSRLGRRMSRTDLYAEARSTKVAIAPMVEPPSGPSVGSEDIRL